MMNPTPILAVTGATGFVGRAIVRQARAEGFAVRAIVRDLNAAAGWAGCDGVELFHGNVIFAPSLEHAFEGANAVIHLVGIIHEWRENTFQRVHTDATINVVDAAKKAGVKRYIHMSALGTRPDAHSRYHQTKWAAEEYVRRSGLAWTIFRPSLIYGPDDKSINVLANLLRRLPFVPVLGNGCSLIQPVSVSDVAKCFVDAVRIDDAITKTYDLCGPAAFTWNDLYDQLLAGLNLRRPKLHLPLSIARLQAGVFEKLLPHPPFTRDQLIMTQEDNVGDPEPAEHLFLLRPEPFAAGIARYLQPAG
jgi:NADH dehydrogenase